MTVYAQVKSTTYSQIFFEYAGDVVKKNDTWSENLQDLRQKNEGVHHLFTTAFDIQEEERHTMTTNCPHNAGRFERFRSAGGAHRIAGFEYLFAIAWLESSRRLWEGRSAFPPKCLIRWLTSI